MERSNPDLIAAFAKTLRRHRKALGLSQEELAFRAGLSVSFLSYLETRRRQPSLTVLDALCRELGISLATLAEEIDREQQNRD
ncbi:MAG: helix-turn-helix transcriptional regulator [Maritimibacter sp.]